MRNAACTPRFAGGNSVARHRKPPSYGRKLDRGVERARVTLFCSVTRRRIDIYLGRYGSPESRQAYARIVAEWEASNRAVRRTEGQRRLQAPGLTVNQLLSQFWPAAQQTYSRGELAPLKLVVRMLRDHCGYMAAAAVGPNTFRGMRHLMIEQRLARTTINKQMRRAVAIFRWGVAHELVSPLTHQALSTLEPLKRGRTEAPAHGAPPRPRGRIPVSPPSGSCPAYTAQTGAPSSRTPAAGAVSPAPADRNARCGNVRDARSCDAPARSSTRHPSSSGRTAAWTAARPSACPSTPGGRSSVQRAGARGAW